MFPHCFPVVCIYLPSRECPGALDCHASVSNARVQYLPMFNSMMLVLILDTSFRHRRFMEFGRLHETQLVLSNELMSGDVPMVLIDDIEYEVEPSGVPVIHVVSCFHSSCISRIRRLDCSRLVCMGCRDAPLS